MWLLMVLAGSPALAQDCDATALAEALAEATPATVAAGWAKLANCDEAVAKEHAAATFETALPGKDAYDALILGIEQGLGDDVRGYLQRIPSDERSKALGFLGGQCDEHAAIGPFFVASHEALGAEFWAERWQRGLTTCRTPEVRKLLGDALYGDEVGVKTAVDRAQFFSVLEVYARNLRGEALPTLDKLARELESDEEVTFVISAFGDAAGVGAPEGIDPKVASETVKTLEALGPELPALATEQARGILLALGDERAADAYARFRWPAAYRLGGYAYRYGVVVTESATCKNGKKQAIAHTAQFTEPGELWPEQVAELIKEKLAFEWELDGSNLCAGEYTVDYATPTEPFESAEDAAAWIVQQVTTFHEQTADYKKAIVRKHDDFEL